MESKWKKCLLSDVSKIDTGFAFKGKDYTEDGSLRVIRGKNITEGFVRWGNDAKYWDLEIKGLEKYKNNIGDIVIGMDGSKIGKNRAQISSNDMPSILAQRVGRVRANDISDQGFLWQIINNEKFELYIQLIQTGTSIPHISLTQISNYEINLPPLPEQKAIAQILSSLDNKIELNRQMNQTLEQMAQAMFKSWFVDFDPFQEEEFINSENGNIPSSFEVKTIGDYIRHQKGFAFKSKWYQETGQFVVRVSDTTENSINKNSCNKIADEIANDYRKYALNTNDIIIATVGSWPPNYSSVVGKVVRVPETVKGGLLNQNAVKLEMIINDNKHQALLYFILKDKRFLDYIVSRAQGSANQASIKLTDIFSYQIPMIENDKLFEISQYLEVCIAKQNKALKEIETLTQLRDTLLPKLISGELPVPEVLI
ncbi:MAG: hypothetical protein B7C24_01405 [Bacteroidetes bacterium 4572_77]|nr:MAG: hypothetical protein B7C24_01405 [Bacteroidetes bacterium 4572_77]